MSIYKTAIFENITIPTSRGNLTPQQLTTLKLDDLEQIANQLFSQIDETSKLTFRKRSGESKAQKTLKVQFELVKDILETKEEEQEAATNERAKKEYNAKILEKISAKEESELDNLSIEELRAKLK